MRRLIHGGRRIGKTTKAIALAIESGACLVVPDRDRAKQIKDEVPDLKRVLSWEELLQGKLLGTGVRKIVIDDLDRCIEMQFRDEIIAVTMSAPLDRLKVSEVTLKQMELSMSPDHYKKMILDDFEDTQ